MMLATVLLFRNSSKFFRRFYRTIEADPRKHNESHLGSLYRVPNELAESTLGQIPNAFIPTAYMERCNLFNEYCLMVRNPALEIFSYIRQLDWTSSWTKRFVVWGRPGCGKSVTLGHVSHFCHLEGFVILNFHKIRNWLFRYKEMCHSEWKEGRIDHIVDSQNFLKQFLFLNEDKISHLKTHREYVWSPREKTEDQLPLKAVIDQGIVRPKFAADCLNVLMRELKLSCQEERCKLVVMIDGINGIFEDFTMVHREQLSWRFGAFAEQNVPSVCAAPDELSVIWNLKKLIKDSGSVSGSNGIILVCSVDRFDKPVKVRQNRSWDVLQLEMKPNTVSDFPHALLQEAAWPIMDPFIPIEVNDYTQEELDTMIDYYVEKRYIKKVAGSEAGRQEIHFLTGRNPRDFMNFSHFW